MTTYKTIPDLPAASVANSSDLLEVSQGGASRRVTLAQIQSHLTGAVHVGDYGASASGDATAAILAAANAAVAASLPLHFAPITYTISQITFPTGLHIRFNGATLRADGTVTGNASIVLVTGGSFDDLRMTTPAVTGKVPIQVFDGCTGNSIWLKADAQSDNNLGNELSSAVRLRGANVTVDDIYVENFDFGGIAGSTTSTPGSNIRIKRWQGRSQITALLIRNCIGFSALELVGDVLSPNVTAGDGGFGSMFATGAAQDVNIGSVWCRGAREHGWRCGGQAGTPTPNKNITIGRITSINACRTGVKINNDEVDGDTRYSGIDIGPILVENSSFSSTPDENENGLLVEDCDGCTFGPVTVVNTDGLTASSYYGISIRNCTNVSIRPGSLLKNCVSAAVHMRPFSQAATGVLKSIHVGKTKVIDCSSDACLIDCPADTIEDFIVDIDSQNSTGFAWRVNALAVTAPVILRGNVHTAAGGSYTGSLDPDIVHVYTLVGGIPANAATAVVTSSAYTVGPLARDIISANAAITTLTLPPFATSSGRMLSIVNRANFTVISAASDVQPKTGGATGTAILAGTPGVWCEMKCDGAKWIILRAGT